MKKQKYCIQLDHTVYISALSIIALLGLLATTNAQETAFTEPIVTNYLNSFLLLALAIINIVLTLKPNVPILNFTFGMISIGVGAWTGGQTLLLGGFLTVVVIVTALVCMLSAYLSMRR